MSSLNNPGAMAQPVAVWTGTHVIAWDQAWPSGMGGMFDPVANGWTRWISVANGPGSRLEPSAVWAGSRMIVWGGIDYVHGWDAPAVGGIYDPGTDTWTPTSAAGAPEGRWYHSAVSTGSRMIVWGGATSQFEAYLNTGGFFDPVANTWQPIPTSGAPSPRGFHAAVWTGSKLIVWGGTSDSTGGVFDPAIGSWKPTSTAGAPAPRGVMTAVWTGTKMIVWGGAGEAGSPALNSGGQYDPATDSWTPTSLVGAPVGRFSHSVVWTGTRMIVWGGAASASGPTLGTGGIYDPVRDTWSDIAASGPPSPRLYHAAVWTGSRMVVWGGMPDTSGNASALATGAIYSDPAVLP